MKLFISMHEYVASLPPSEQAFWLDPAQQLPLHQLQETREWQDMVIRRYIRPAAFCIFAFTAGIVAVTVAITAITKIF